MATGSGKNAVVAGGGTVGALAAIMLARQGWTVQVFERWGLPSSQPQQHDTRAYSLNLNLRSIDAFKLAGVNLDSIVKPHGGQLDVDIFGMDGQLTRSAHVAVRQQPVALRAFRDEVSRHVIEEAQRLHGHAITFHFNAAVERVDLDAHTILVSQQDPHATKLIPYDLLVGADGANSVVRSALQKIMPSTFIRCYTHQHVYSTTAVEVPDATVVPPHAFFQVHPFQEGAVLWDGRGVGICRVGVMLRKHQAGAIREGRPERVLQGIQSGLPKLPDCARQALQGLVKSQPQFFPVPTWMYLSQMHGPKTVLLGDAAHTMSPVMAQGLNSGLEDVMVFTQLLEQHSGNVDSALPAFTQQRLPDIRALVMLNELLSTSDVRIEPQDYDMPHKLWLLAHKVLLGVYMVSHTLLHKAAPQMFAGPKMMPMIMGKCPYRAVTTGMYQCGLVLAGLLTVITAAAMQLCTR